jgi:hypothetical protein
MLPGDLVTFTFSGRFARPVAALNQAYVRAFGNAPRYRLGLVETEGYNGASGFWARGIGSGESPIFLIECAVGASVQPEFEQMLAHEFAHPIIRLRGIPTAISFGQIDSRIGDEFTSTSHHPYVFQLQREWGYERDEPGAVYERAARGELEKLLAADLASPTYTGSPGQTWLALWYFNFSLMAPARYAELLAFHLERVPAIAEKMIRVVDCWEQAVVAGGNNWAWRVRRFQERLMDSLDLHGKVQIQQLADWRAWLFAYVASSA